MTESHNSPRNVHQAVARALRDLGVDTLFGLMGDANMYMVDSFIRDYGGRFVAAAHEAGATMMALGYASLSGKPGVCSVTHGPGMTNTITGLVEGVKGGLPLVMLCGDTDPMDRENLQDVSQREFIIHAGAGFEQLRSAQTATQDLARVFRRAIVERRPVALNLPVSLDWSSVDNYSLPRVRVPEHRAAVSTGDDLDNAIGIIAAAKRPLILVGRGAISAEAKAAILRLAKRLEAPLATTLKAKDLFRGEDFNLGISGTLSSPVAVETIMESDCIIAFGASLNKYTMSYGAFVRGKRIIQIAREAGEIGSNVDVHAGLVGDPAEVADVIVHWLNEAEIPPSRFCTEDLKQRLTESSDRNSVAEEYGDGTVGYRTALARLDRILPADRVLVTDGGRFMIEAWKRISVPSPREFLSTINFASIGLGLSHAIGAGFARPAQPVVLLVGDGGFMHGGLMEFNTAVRNRCDLIVVVCNDRGYGAEYTKFRDRQMPPDSILFDWPDLAPVAIALGGEGVTIRSARDWALAEQAIKTRTKPLLIDVKLDPANVPWDR